MALITSAKNVPSDHGTEFEIVTPLKEERVEYQVLSFSLH